MGSGLRWLAGGALLGAGGLAAAGGCSGGGDYDCAEDLVCEILNDDGTSNGRCWGRCVPPPPGNFHAPELVWTGPDLFAPSCDDLVWAVPGTVGEVVRLGYEPASFRGRTVSEEDATCPTCACTPPSCALPSEVTANSLPLCGEGPEETRTPFGPPPDWDGACVSPGRVAPEQLASLAIGPIRQLPCTPVVEEEPVPRDAFTFEVAVACESRLVPGLCALGRQLCMLYQQQDHLPEGWRHCVRAEGEDVPCEAPAEPGNPWPTYSEKVGVFYTAVNDTRECEPCSCKPPERSQCAAFVSAYQDNACSDPFLVISVPEAGSCVDPAPGFTLGSLSATWIVNEPGPCTPEGGTPVGEKKGDGAETICCLPRER
ncbi:hypothetical protein WME95_30410 [Sorangium sp. So ce327]|jgi:hypothetical protein|uniref:hypothetical protein n=1 Tax=unclassified Sorangium TaxID=2621164 RepID=UPI003F5E55E0